MQGRQDPERRHQRAAADIGDLAGGLDRPPFRLAGEAEQADQAEVVHVVPGALDVRPGLAVAGDRAVDERLVFLAHALVADAEPVEDAGAEALEDDVEVRTSRSSASRPPSDLRSSRIERLLRLSDK